MAIPDDSTLKRELLGLIAAQPGHRLRADEAYRALAQLHPELTDEELTVRYKNSISKWANRVQFARLHLANEGLLYRANQGPDPAHGVWIATAQRLRLAHAESDSRLSNLEAVVAADLEAWALEEGREEGGKSYRLTSHYERDRQLRALAIAVHGTDCKGCGFSFSRAYGEHGKDYVEVHHIKAVSTYQQPTMVNPRADLTVLCANCHRMVHRQPNSPLSIDDLRAMVSRQRRANAEEPG